MKETVVAVVLLAKAASGKSSSESATEAAASFHKLGFEVVEIVGGNLTISGNRRLFEKIFGSKVEKPDRAANRGFTTAGGQSVLPKAALPGPLQALVDGIEFQRPPDFGPGNF